MNFIPRVFEMSSVVSFPASARSTVRLNCPPEECAAQSDCVRSLAFVQRFCDKRNPTPRISGSVVSFHMHKHGEYLLRVQTWATETFRSHFAPKCVRSHGLDSRGTLALDSYFGRRSHAKDSAALVYIVRSLVYV